MREGEKNNTMKHYCWDKRMWLFFYWASCPRRRLFLEMADISVPVTNKTNPKKSWRKIEEKKTKDFLEKKNE